MLNLIANNVKIKTIDKANVLSVLTVVLMNLKYMCVDS